MNAQQSGRSWPKALSVAACVFLADQAIKAWIRSELVVNERRDLLGPIDLVSVRNKGVAFGALGGSGLLVPVLTAIAAFGVIVWFVRQGPGSLAWLPCGLVLGGAAGNLFDRLTDGAVTDFVKLPHWPAFNLADVAITVGVVVLVVVAESESRSG